MNRGALIDLIHGDGLSMGVDLKGGQDSGVIKTHAP